MRRSRAGGGPDGAADGQGGSGHRTDPPIPGDPRSEGPRPGPTWRDTGWALVATLVSVVTVAQLGRVAYVAASAPDVVLSTGRLLLAFVITVLWLLTAFWVAVGSWRRSVWGCPFDHLRTAPPARRCPRHRLLGATADTDAGAAEAGGEPPADPGR